MMGPRQVAQGALFYEFSIEDHVPPDHLLRAMDRFVDLGDMRRHLAPFYSSTGRPSVDPELMIRMLIVGYAFGIRLRPPSGSKACLMRPSYYKPPGMSSMGAEPSIAAT
jgi:hypothetical protein